MWIYFVLLFLNSIHPRILSLFIFKFSNSWRFFKPQKYLILPRPSPITLFHKGECEKVSLVTYAPFYPMSLPMDAFNADF